MPSATIPRTITQQETAEALRQQLGSGYKVTPHSRDKLTVSHGGLAFASVHLAPDGNATVPRPRVRPAPATQEKQDRHPVQTMINFG